MDGLRYGVRIIYIVFAVDDMGHKFRCNLRPFHAFDMAVMACVEGDHLDTVHDVELLLGDIRRIRSHLPDWFVAGPF